MTHPQRPDPPHRDSRLDAAWKAHSTELPPQHVDAAILAAAHREARTRPRAVGDDDGIAHARSPSRAWWGFAAAATIGAIAFGVLQLAPPPSTDQAPTVASDIPNTAPERATPAPASRDVPSPLADAQRSPASDAPAATREEDRAAFARAPDPVPSATLPDSTQKAAEPKRRRADALERPRAPAVDSSAAPAAALAEAPAVAPAASPEAAAPAPLPFPGVAPGASLAAAPPPSAPPAELAKSEGAGNAADAQRRESGERTAAAAPTQPSAQAQRRAQADAAATVSMPKLHVLTPPAWIERIRMLHAQQRFDEAARELNAFRDAHADADARLPVELRGWAASIRRN